MNVKTKKTMLAGVLVASVVTIIWTVSYAYFTATGASVNQTATISTAKVSAVFADADTGANATLNFGESFTKKFAITNNGNVPAHVKMYWKDLVNTYTKESLSYTLSKSATGDVGSYTVFVGGGETKSLVPQSKIASTKLLASDIEVPVGTTYYELTVTLNYLADVNQDSDLTAKFYSWFELQDINYDDSGIVGKIIASSKGAITNFASPASDSESAGVYELADENDTTSYYFRGPVENNYVKFGKWREDEPDVYVGHDSSGVNIKDFASLSACQADSIYNFYCTLSQRAGKDMYWRIIRVNGDGSLRMIYAGTQAYANGSQGADTFIGASAFNANDDAKYVGYMYAPSGITASTSKAQAQTNTESSIIKGVLETWYEKNLETNYGQCVSKNAIYCYDRSTPGKDATGLSTDTALGYGTNTTIYGTASRVGGPWKNGLITNPTFVCPEENDKYTVLESSQGNKSLSKPVGLITIDEIVAAGSGKYGTASDYYLKRNLSYWSGTPLQYNSRADNYYVYTDGCIGYMSVSSYISFAPVINLTAEYAKTLVGDGTINNVYRDPNA